MSDKQPTYQVYPIGYVEGDEAEGFTLEILEPYRPALKHLAKFSHVKVYWWFDQADAPEWRSMMQSELPYAEGVTAGMFACRGPARPNPIAETICAVIDVDEANGVVRLPWIDAFDGTPVLDLKPYIPVSDRVRDVRVAEWCEEWPEWMEDGAAFFADADIDMGG
jgi:tRNA-Thr(GGU) m(6)t(6)A37 methyltransferase TsaA